MFLCFFFFRLCRRNRKDLCCFYFVEGVPFNAFHSSDCFTLGTSHNPIVSSNPVFLQRPTTRVSINPAHACPLNLIPSTTATKTQTKTSSSTAQNTQTMCNTVSGPPELCRRPLCPNCYSLLKWIFDGKHFSCFHCNSKADYNCSYGLSRPVWSAQR